MKSRDKRKGMCSKAELGKIQDQQMQSGVSSTSSCCPQVNPHRASVKATTFLAGLASVAWSHRYLR